MDLRIIIEPEYQNSFWCTETMKGLSNQAYLRKIRLTEIKEAGIRHLKNGQTDEVVIIIGTSINWLNRITSLIQQKNILCLLVTGDQNANAFNRTNALLLDYQSRMYMLLSYLRATGNERIALFGINPSSYADSVEEKHFPWKNDIYYNYGSIANCAEQIWHRINNYSAVICANYIIAIYLYRFLIEKGIRIPDDLHLISFGDSYMSRLMPTSFISMETNFRTLGEEAVSVCSFLVKNPTLTVNAFLKCPLQIQNATAVQNLSPADDLQEPIFPDVHFYEDEDVSTIQSLNRLLAEGDCLDIKILRCLLDGETQEKTAELMHLSLSSLRYRIRKLRAYFPKATKNEMLDIIRYYLSPEALTTAENIKQKEETLQGTP